MKKGNKKRKCECKWWVCASLIINALLILGIIGTGIAYHAGAFDYKIVEVGKKTQCSDRFREKEVKRLQAEVDMEAQEQKYADQSVARLDLECNRDKKATELFAEKVQQYFKYLGIE